MALLSFYCAMYMYTYIYIYIYIYISRELRSAAALGRFRTRDAQRATGAKTVQGLVHQHPKGWGVQAPVKDNYCQKNTPRW